jgi:hypothetical protein
MMINSNQKIIISQYFVFIGQQYFKIKKAASQKRDAAV